MITEKDFILKIKSYPELYCAYKKQGKDTFNKELWSKFALENRFNSGVAAECKWRKLVANYISFLLYGTKFPYEREMQFMQMPLLNNSNDDTQSDSDIDEVELKHIVDSCEDDRPNDYKRQCIDLTEDRAEMPNQNGQSILFDYSDDKERLYSPTPSDDSMLFYGFEEETRSSEAGGTEKNDDEVYSDSNKEDEGVEVMETSGEIEENEEGEEPAENFDMLVTTIIEEVNVEVPNVQAPTLEAPTVEAPIVEDLTNEQSIEEDHIDVTPIIESPIVDSAHVDTPILKPPITEKPNVQTPVVQPSVTEPPIIKTPIISDNISNCDQNTASSFTNLSSLELIFLGYAKVLQKMPLRLQLHTKRKIADIMDEAELEMLEDKYRRTDN